MGRLMNADFWKDECLECMSKLEDMIERWKLERCLHRLWKHTVMMLIAVVILLSVTLVIL